jgi:hypothetical protein
MIMRSIKEKATGLLLCLAFLSWPSTVSAVKYMSIGKAVKSFIPKGSKIIKVTKTLTAEQIKRLINDYSWKPQKDQVFFYVGRDASGTDLAYVLIQPELFNTCFHKYAIGIKPNGEVIDTVIVELSCPRAMPVNKKSFLKQFKGKRHSDPLTTKLDIDAVTGATLSSESAAQATRKAVSLHNLLFGGGKPVNLSEKVKKARDSGNALILKAIETKETVSK